LHSRLVFPKAGKPVRQRAMRARKQGLQGAAIEDAGRVCAIPASWHVQRGTPLHVLQELGGWASIKMVQRYADLSGEHPRDGSTSRRRHLSYSLSLLTRPLPLNEALAEADARYKSAIAR